MFRCMFRWFIIHYIVFCRKLELELLRHSFSRVFTVYGYGSIPMKIPFLVGYSSINPSYFDVNKKGDSMGFDTLPLWFLGTVRQRTRTIDKAYFWGLWKGISPENIWKYGLIWYSSSILGSWNSHWIRYVYIYIYDIYDIYIIVSVLMTILLLGGQSCACGRHGWIRTQSYNTACLIVAVFFELLSLDPGVLYMFWYGYFMVFRYFWYILICSCSDISLLDIW